MTSIKDHLEDDSLKNQFAAAIFSAKNVEPNQTHAELAKNIIEHFKKQFPPTQNPTKENRFVIRCIVQDTGSPSMVFGTSYHQDSNIQHKKIEIMDDKYLYTLLIWNVYLS